MWTIKNILALYFITLTYPEFGNAQDGIFYGIEGSFCETRAGGCCPGRMDDCHTPILNHLCYCDDFCDGDETTYRKDHDCCPDFSYFCRGVPRPPAKLTAACNYDGTPYTLGSSRKHNCNECKCEDTGNPESGAWVCEEKECIIDEGIIEAVNQGDYLWRASNYSEFWGRDLSDGIIYRLGTLLPEKAVFAMKPVRQIFEPEQIPRSFDSRSNPSWPNYIQPVSDQGWCGSDWAVSIAAITADRLAIQSKGTEITKLSAQQLLACDSKGQEGCEGGHLDRAWNFMRTFGIVDEDCFPYVSGQTEDAGRCLISRSASLLDCKTSNPPANRTEPYKTGPSYRISQYEDDIKYEILTYGPVHAVMEVSPDFFMYRSGIYKKSNLKPGSRVGFHSVRILGWGEEYRRGQDVKYWIVANSWGTAWGENGTFRILRGENECDIEKFVIAAWARQANERAYYARKQLRSLIENSRFLKWQHA